jgi:hypothetical protein
MHPNYQYLTTPAGPYAWEGAYYPLDYAYWVTMREGSGHCFLHLAQRGTAMQESA